ncbi:glycerophosphoryl diester phosphodiesterase membrane domain-containing protein [Mucilaginibacter aquatilis]|uniref:Glycerophosphoryl diester phosphodiesterase membrane domain-containing protein n=1 Tax=Mucilaginibacter aquatilis TaxID=1517760 RepID=A0A6I4IH14_9SPHI|nr:glycerophosphoryl diester phosphodiesterase membrane domain-containing protein [Mucilaginibacter aquatilis]MVN92898.1 hypothetical protein [Mucilaginibacter aquatilis]
MYHPFTISDTIKAAWDVIKKNYVSLIVYSVISLIFYEVISFLTGFIVVYDNQYSQVAFVFFMMLVQSYLVLSFYKLILTLMDKEYYEFEFSDILPSFRMALSFVTIGVLYTVLIATIIFINLQLGDSTFVHDVLDKIEILGVAYLLVRSIYCLCFIVDEDSGPFESLRQSFSITRGHFFRLLGLILLVVGFVALLLIIINLFITSLFDVDNDSYIFKIAAICWFAISFPTVQVMIMTSYRKLVYSHKDIDDDVSETL